VNAAIVGTAITDPQSPNSPIKALRLAACLVTRPAVVLLVAVSSRPSVTDSILRGS